MLLLTYVFVIAFGLYFVSLSVICLCNFIIHFRRRMAYGNSHSLIAWQGKKRPEGGFAGPAESVLQQLAKSEIVFLFILFCILHPYLLISI